MSFDVLKTLRTELRELFAGTVYRDPAVKDRTADDAFTPLRVYLGALPPKRSQGQTNEDFPFLVLRLTEGDDGDNVDTLTVQIIAGIYAELAPDDPAETAEEAGAQTIHQVLDRIRSHLRAKPLLAQRYRLQLPMRWTTGNDKERNQPHPYYVGQIDTTWDLPAALPLEDPEERIDIYGDGLP